MEGTHEVGWRPFMPASTLSGRSVALLRVRLDDCTPSEGQLISHGNCARSIFCLPVSATWISSIDFVGKSKRLTPRSQRSQRLQRLQRNYQSCPMVRVFVTSV